jgi:prepilin-type processing-associated H-X9-DG protein
MAQSDPVLDTMKPLLEEDTFCVVHIDLMKLDTTAILNNNREFLEKTFADLGVSREELHNLVAAAMEGAPAPENVDFEKNWQQMLGAIEGGKTLVTDMLGIKEAFLIMGFGKIFPVLSYVAIPKTPDLNVEMIKMWESEQWIILHETDGYLVLTTSAWVGNMTDNTRKAMIDNFVPSRPVERPDLLAAYDAVKEAPVQILFAVPQYFKRIVTELRPGLSEKALKQVPALRGFDVPALVNGFHFKALGLDPEAGRLNIVIETETEHDAQTLVKQLHVLFDAGIDVFVQYLEELDARKTSDDTSLVPQEEIVLSFYPDVFNRESLTQLKDTMLPQPEGNRFAVQWDRDSAGEYFSTSGILLTKLIQINVETAREASRRMQCANNMKMLGLAMHTYHDANGIFPPTFSVDENGKPLHSWRVYVLPYLEQSALYEAIRKDEPWDSEYNRQFHDKMPPYFRCPSCTLGNPKRDTTYCMVVGEESLGRADGVGLKLSRITDGTSNTVAFVERKTPVCWMAPEDVTFDDAVQGTNRIPTGIGSEHGRGANITFCDGSMHFIHDTIDPSILRAILTIAGRESVSWPILQQ